MMRSNGGIQERRTKEPAMKFYEIPLSPITESCHQILFQVAIAVIRDHVRPPYLCTRKQACGVCRGSEGIIPLKGIYRQ